jgi:transposase-like protein
MTCAGGSCRDNSIPKTAAPEYQISNAVGQACYDHRVIAGLDYDEDRADFIGPFLNEDEFNHALRCDALPEVIHRGGHKIVFAYGDLNMRNIMVENGKGTGIVDWETAGFYPSYWEYTKAHFVTKRHWRWLRVVNKVSKELGDYQRELRNREEALGILLLKSPVSKGRRRYIVTPSMANSRDQPFGIIEIETMVS